MSVAVAAAAIIVLWGLLGRVNSFDDIIAAVDYRAADVPAGRPSYSTGWDEWGPGHPAREMFRGEDVYLTRFERFSRAFCIQISKSSVQSKSEPFGPLFQDWKRWGLNSDDRDNFDLGTGFDKRSEDGQQLVNRIKSGSSYKGGSDFRNGFVAKYRDTSPRSVLRHLHDIVGLPYSSRSLNHHGCRDAMISFYHSNGGTVGLLIYKQKAGPIEVDVMIGSSAKAVEAEMTSENFHWTGK